MKEKLTLQDIVDLLAKKANLSKKDADVFFREFFAVILDNVFKDDPVKIKDFGTFKLTKVSSRESVDVNTGEKIEIPAHYKLSFLPDKTLKNLVNKPFAHFETTLLEEGVSFDQIEESEELAENTEDEDTGIDDAEIKEVSPSEKKTAPAVNNTEETAKADDDKEDISSIDQPQTQEEENKDQIQTQEQEQQPVKVLPVEPQSFVYTYTSSSKEDDDSQQPIVMVIPSDVVIPTETVVDIDLTDSSVLKSDTTSIEINKVQEKIDQLKEAIEALTKVKNEAETQTEFDEEESARIIAAGNEQLEIDEEFAELLQKSSDLEEEERVIPEVVTEGTDESLDEQMSDQEQEFEEDYIFDDYYRETAFARIRKKLPLIILLLAVIGIGGYQFYKLFNQPHSYERYRGLRDYPTAADSLKYGLDTLKTTTPIVTESDSLDDIISDVADTLPKPVSTDDNVVVLPKDSSAQAAADTAAVAAVDSLKVEEVIFDRIISDYLKIKVLNKGAYMRAKEKAEGLHPEPVFEVVGGGASLRSIARKHFGSSIFWVYIYEVNKAKIPDYNNLSAGVELVIPDPKKYDIDVNDSLSIDKAKKLEQKILNVKSV